MTPTEHAQLLRELANCVRRGQSATRFRAKAELEDVRLLDDNFQPESVRQDMLWVKKADEVIARARQAAEEIEGANVSGEQFSLTLTLEMIALVAHGGGLTEFSDPHKALVEIRNLSQPWLGDQIDSLQRKEAARFGGGEPASEAKMFQVYDDAYAAETHLAENHCNNEGIEWDEDAVDARANRAGLRAVLARFGGGERIMSDQPQPRPPLWRALPQRMGAFTSAEVRAVAAMQIRAVATYIKTHGLINATGKATPRMGARLLGVFAEEAQRAEAGE